MTWTSLDSGNSGASPPRWAFCFWPVSSLLGCSWLPRGCLSPARRPAGFSIFLPPHTRCTCLGESLLCFTFCCAISRRARFPATPPWKSLPTTGTSWTACGSFCWRFFTWASNLRLLPDEVAYRLRHARELGRPQFRVHRQRQHLLCGMLGVRKISDFVRQRGIKRLEVQRHGIVDGAADLFLLENLAQGVALFHANRVLMEDMFIALGNQGRHDAGNLRKMAGVFRGMGLPRALPRGKMAKLDAKDGGLDFIEPAVPAGFAADVFFLLPVIAQKAQAGGALRGIGDNHACIAARTQIFRGIKAEASDVAKRAGAASFVCGADGLRRVLDDRQISPVRKLQNRVHIRGEAVQVDHYDGTNARSHAVLLLRGGDVVGIGVNIGENRVGAERADRAAGGDKGEGRQNDLVASRDTASAQREHQSIGARTDADSVRHAAEARDFLLERFPFPSQDKLL